MDKETEDAFKNLGSLINNSFGKMDGRLNNMESRLNNMESRLNNMDGRLNNMPTKVEMKTIIHAEVKDIREAIEERCKPTQIG